ncbi:MAG: leucine-rich repeat protein [Clostridium sp.]|nr:leucine-rich repeat protein [Clostridium sp.]
MRKVKVILVVFLLCTLLFQGIPGTSITWIRHVNAADYTNGGCVDWVKDRASQIGITLPATGLNKYGKYGASAYWTTLSSYAHGSEPAANSLAVWEFNNQGNTSYGQYGHVAYVESVSGDNVTVTEGGCAGYSYNGNTGVICRTQSKSKMATLGGCSGFYGYIYLSGNPHTHSYTSTITKQPTCTAAGTKTFRCSCGNSYTESIAAKGHSYANKKVEPTMTEKGYTLHTCSSCGNSYKDNYINPPELKTDGWYYCDTIPSGITSDKYTIEYNNYYEKIQKSSPGSGWTNAGVVKNEWQNSGSQYTSESDLATSDARILVRSVYYHFCGPNAGAEGNYEQTGKFVHYDEIGAASVIVQSSGMDGTHPYYLLNWIDGGGRVRCASGVTCDGSFGTHGERCQAWYKMNTYQDRVKVEQYKFTKQSGWVNTKDTSAKSIKIRFAAKHTHSYASEVVEQASCEKNGKKKFTCSCGDSYEQAILAAGHTIVTDEAVAASCTVDGKTDGSHCSVCGEILKKAETVKATGHVYVLTGTNEDGMPVYQCSKCGKSMYENEANEAEDENEESETDANGMSTDEDDMIEEGSVEILPSGTYTVKRSSNAVREVSLSVPALSKKRNYVIPDVVSINNKKYKVTEIEPNAFKNNKKLKSVTIGKNIKKIGKNAFYGCKNLKKITIKSSVLKSVGKNAIKGTNKKAVIKCPKKQLKKYKKLLKKSTGYKKSMRIKR